MDFLPTEEQSMIVDSCRQFLAGEMPLQRFQHPHNDLRHWPALGGLGWFGIGVDMALGGAGYTLMEELLICREAGRHLLSPALLSSLLGAQLCAATGQQELAAALVAGETHLGLALPRPGAVAGTDAVTGDWLLLEAEGTAFTLVVTADAAAIVSTPATAPRPGMDETVAVAGARLESVKPLCAQAGSHWYRRGRLLCAALAVGQAEQAKALSVAYACEREQFGKPIGSFQALKHRCADMAVRDEAALSLLIQAGLASMDELPQAAFDVPAAKLLADQAAQANAADAVHIHGAMGFTREMPVQLFVKRAHLLGQLFGGRTCLLAELAPLATPA